MTGLTPAEVQAATGRFLRDHVDALRSDHPEGWPDALAAATQARGATAGALAIAVLVRLDRLGGAPAWWSSDAARTSAVQAIYARVAPGPAGRAAVLSAIASSRPAFAKEAPTFFAEWTLLCSSTPAQERRAVRMPAAAMVAMVAMVAALNAGRLLPTPGPAAKGVLDPTGDVVVVRGDGWRAEGRFGVGQPVGLGPGEVSVVAAVGAVAWWSTGTGCRDADGQSGWTHVGTDGAAAQMGLPKQGEQLVIAPQAPASGTCADHDGSIITGRQTWPIGPDRAPGPADTSAAMVRLTSADATDVVTSIGDGRATAWTREVIEARVVSPGQIVALARADRSGLHNVWSVDPTGGRPFSLPDVRPELAWVIIVSPTTLPSGQIRWTGLPSGARMVVIEDLR